MRVVVGLVLVVVLAIVAGVVDIARRERRALREADRLLALRRARLRAGRRLPLGAVRAVRPSDGGLVVDAAPRPRLSPVDDFSGFSEYGGFPAKDK
jgi:hypothetical protein